jgi:hypothetical protein
MGRVKSIGFHQHVMRRRQKVTMMGIAGGTEKRPQRLRNQLGACHDLAVLTSLTAPRGEAFVKKWGVLRIFIGRFLVPYAPRSPSLLGFSECRFGRFNWPISRLPLYGPPCC